MEIVIDSSMALAWALPDETSSRADRLLARADRASVFWVPALWWYEVTNALIVAQRRQRLAGADRTRIHELYGMLPIETDTALNTHTMWRIDVLAEKYVLSAYDAAYLELAQRRDLKLATFDRRLAGAAQSAGIGILRG